MDNITHTLVGACAAEGVLRWAPERIKPRRRGALHLASILANNLPDVDFAYSWITSGKLGYLLHHRGHTHTLPLALGLGLGVALSFRIWLRRAANKAPQSESSDSDGFWILLLVTFGGLLHLAMDFGNNYGVHPFWPFDNRWYYGDAIFIIEPLLWIGLGGTLTFLLKTPTMRGVAALVACSGLGFVWLLPVPLSGALAASAAAALVLLVTWRVKPASRRLGVALVLTLLLYAVQLWARSGVGSSVERALEHEPQLRRVDLVRSPIPATPWCWEVILVSEEEGLAGPDYVLRVGRVALWPELVPPLRCPRIRQHTTAPTRAPTKPPGVPTPPNVSWDLEYRIPLAELTALRDDCWFRAFLRFSRAPFYDSARGLVGDLRYDRSVLEDFAEFRLPVDAACPKWVPPWIPPRSELLGFEGDAE